MKYNNGSKVTNYPNVSMRRPDSAINTGSTEQGGMKVDPSVRLGELRGEPPGSVPLERTMAKPQAYQAKRGAP